MPVKFFNDDLFVKIVFSCIPATILSVIDGTALSIIAGLTALAIFTFIFHSGNYIDKEMMGKYSRIAGDIDARHNRIGQSRIAMLIMWVIFIISLYQKVK